MAKTRCCICGKEKAVSIDPGTGKPYELQICKNDECMGKAWNIVTKALKRGVRPVFDTYPEKRTYVKLTDEQKDGIIRMYLEGCRRANIARETGTTYSNISYVIKKYREGKRK